MNKDIAFMTIIIFKNNANYKVSIIIIILVVTYYYYYYLLYA